MLRINFFPSDIITEYEQKITDTVKGRNNKNSDIEFIPQLPCPKSSQYKISIHDLLTSERSQILKIRGVKLYMCICSSQKYKSMSNVELLHELHNEYTGIVNENKYTRGNYEYEINGVTYRTSCKADKIAHNIIAEAVGIIKDNFSSHDSVYADYYFGTCQYHGKCQRSCKCQYVSACKYYGICHSGTGQHSGNNIIRSVAGLKVVLERMFTDLNKQLSGKADKLIIDYSILTENQDKNLRHKLMNSIGIRTCPYCNRNYITRYGTNGEKSTADLDHYYQKMQYPLFALSLFNFVPSCSVCNSRMKNTHSAYNTLYPYEEGFDEDAHFELKLKDKDIRGIKTLQLFQALESVDYDDFNVDITVDPCISKDKSKKIQNSKALFHLEEVYANHKQDALEAAFRTRVFCEGSYKYFCQNLFNKLSKHGMENTSASDLDSYMLSDILNDEWLILGIFTNDEKRRFDKPLSRLIYDIYNVGKK